MVRSLFQPSSSEPFALSRSGLELFLDCPHCFTLHRRFGIARPDHAHYSLNLAVDQLLKREFDHYRTDKEPHPVMRLFGMDAVPLQHPHLSTWRDTPQGIRAVHAASRIELYGIVDDVWMAQSGAVHPVDYKATSVSTVPTLDRRDAYRRQLDVYGWLLSHNGFDLAREGYVVFANADRDRASFHRTLHCTLSIATHVLDLRWIDDALLAVRECLEGDVLPPSTTNCVWCAYRRDARGAERSA